jgi:stage II sporulation protein D
MSLPLSDKPLPDARGGPFARCLAARWLWYGALAVVCLVALAVLFHGCERRALVRPTPQMDADSLFWVRVLLLSGATECTLEVPSTFQVVRADQGSALQAGRLALAATSGATRISLTEGRLLLGTTSLAGNELTISPEEPYIFTLNGQKYRGRLKLLVGPGGQTFDAINLIPLEPYLAGVVGAEMPNYWEPEALKAQAVAARTYCLYIKNRFGANRSWDVSKTQANQVYGGVAAESAQVWDAVNSTSGKVLMLREAGSPFEVPYQGRLFPAYYSSICGGHTTDSREVFGDSFEPLRGVPCPYCLEVARLTLFFWPMVQFDRELVTKQLVARYPVIAALGQIEELVVTKKSDYGQFSRAARIKLVGATGKTETLGAEDLRLALDPTGRKIRSMICQIVPWGNGWAFLAGRGWGHGVGMCQCGAEGMARLGKDAATILQYYYPGCEIASLY